jgi:hypothetical protein
MEFHTLASPLPLSAQSVYIQFLGRFSMEVAGLAFQVFDTSELVSRSKIAIPPIDGEPLRIRLRFEADVIRDKRKKVITILRKIGYRQVGNSTSWVLN